MAGVPVDVINISEHTIKRYLYIMPQQLFL